MILTSSLDVTAITIVSSSAPAFIIEFGFAAWPSTVIMSSLSSSAESFDLSSSTIET